MNAVFTILVVLIILAAILLILVVLLQNSKGGGLASNFVAGNQTFGVRQTADLLEKFTWGLIAFIMVVSIITSFTIRKTGSSGVDISSDIENVQEQQPAFPTAPIEQSAPDTGTPQSD
ncbi:MAG: preprotein translocase subunit SecG [Candidatus Cryptobacteroides sp.]|jgi:preprotein translocase subunit SecG|nr:preprotein translocase subunit SecG [Rikenellaceae bacterium]